MSLSWMAWTWPTAAFFIFVALALVALGVWEWFSPGGNLRRGIFGIVTQRGDRFFISLVGTGYITLAWLFFLGTPAWGALLIGVIWALFVFIWV